MRKKSRILLFVMMFALVLSSFTFGNPVAFADNEQENVKEVPSKWAIEDVQKATIDGLVEEDFLNNYDKQLTRQELAQIGVKLYEKLSGKQAEALTSNPFSDTQNEQVLKACNIKLMNGTEEDKFEPEKMVTREELIVVIYNAVKSSDLKLNLNVEKDIKIEGIQQSSLDAVKYMVSKDILKGKSNGDLGLQEACTKEQAIALVRRLYELTVQEIGKASKGLLWKVSGGDSDVYILGSIHIANNELYPLDANIENLIEKTDYLAVEANITEDKEGIKYLIKKAFYTDDNTLKDNVSPETYELFCNKLKEFNIDPETMAKVKPWYAANLALNLDLSKASYNPGLGIDVYLINEAMKNKIDILEIEGIKFQTDMFDNFSPELQEQYLLSSLVANEEGNDSEQENIQAQAVGYMLDLWKKGDAKNLAEFLAKSNESSSQEFNDKFLTERNKNMTKKAIEYLSDKEGKTYFIVVGAGHVVGEKGIVNALKSKGYTVEQILD